jgi:thiosulfate reductase cytochrome b subunit
MCKSETGHLAIGLVVDLMAGYALLRGWWDAAGWLLLFNILINVYPVMLQRYNRARLQPLFEKAD